MRVCIEVYVLNLPTTPSHIASSPHIPTGSMPNYYMAT